MLWLGFAGAWLLFAGPIYQAVLELQDEDIEIERIHATGANVQKPEKTSVWWWLLLPVKLYQEFTSRAEYQRRYKESLSREDIEAIVSYRSKASSWFFVAVGGFCIACNETYVLASYEGWNNLIVLFVIVGMLALSIVHLIIQLRRARAITKS